MIHHIRLTVELDSPGDALTCQTWASKQGYHANHWRNQVTITIENAGTPKDMRDRMVDFIEGLSSRFGVTYT